MNFRFFSQAGIFLFVIYMLVAQSSMSRDLGLQEAFNLAVEHSHQLKKARADRMASEEAFNIAKSERYPTVSASAIGFYNSEVPSLNMDFGTFSFSRDMGTHENYQTDFRLAMPVFTGGRLSGGIKAADAVNGLNHALEQMQIDAIYLLTRVTYLKLYRADRSVDAAQSSLERIKLTQTDVKALFTAGATDSVDLLETKLGVTKAAFHLTAVEHERRSIEIELKVLLDLPLDQELELVDTLPKPVIEDFVQLVDTKPQMLAAQANIGLNRAKVQISRSALTPTLSVFAGYSYGKPNLDHFNNSWNDYWTFGGQLSWSFNFGMQTAHEITKANWGLKASLRERNRIEEELSRDSELAQKKLLFAFEHYTTAKLQYRISLDNYRLAQASHREGALSSNRLIEIETALAESESSVAAALADFYIAQSVYYNAIGSDKLKKGF
ncbi:MAG: TolC family protein [candidate division Zixibacteria bacterium]|nr:TolC family protein [candidate division Zixibacteria bacterium]